MLFTVALVAAAASAHAVQQVPLPPPVTPVQQAAVDESQAPAVAAAAAARATLLQMMANESLGFREYLQTTPQGDEDLSTYTDAELLDMMGAELQCAEVAHNWEPNPATHAIAVDVGVNTTIGYPYFFNAWQLQALNLTPAGNVVLARIETAYFHLKRFEPLWGRPDPAQASERLLYGAVNLMKHMQGNPVFGGVSIVFDNTYIREHTLIAPTDTGTWGISCDPSLPSYINVTLNCDAWPSQAVGTFDHWEHLALGHVVAWDRFYNCDNFSHNPIPGGSNGTYPMWNLAVMLNTFLTKDYARIPKMVDFAGYFEANPLMNVYYKEGVKMMILNAADALFGTPLGTRLQNWAVENDWVLVWSLYPGYFTEGPRNYRFVDPSVLARTTPGRNITSDPRFAPLLKQFEVNWYNTASELRFVAPDKVGQFLYARYIEMWNEPSRGIAGTILQVQPLHRGACANSSCAVIRTLDGACICRA